MAEELVSGVEPKHMLILKNPVDNASICNVQIHASLESVDKSIFRYLSKVFSKFIVEEGKTLKLKKEWTFLKKSRDGEARLVLNRAIIHDKPALLAVANEINAEVRKSFPLGNGCAWKVVNYPKFIYM